MTTKRIMNIMNIMNIRTITGIGKSTGFADALSVIVQTLTRTPYTAHPQEIFKFDLSYWPIYL